MSENRRVRMTKKMMKDSFLELLEIKPMNKITVTDICERADVNRSTFYSYYGDIPMLLQEIEGDVLNQIPVSPDLTAIYTKDLFLDMLEKFFQYVKENERLFRILMIQSDSSHFNKRLVTTVMEKYHKQSLLENTLLGKYGYIFCINGVIGLLKEWISDHFPVSARKFSEIILQMSISANEIDNIEI